MQREALTRQEHCTRLDAQNLISFKLGVNPKLAGAFLINMAMEILRLIRAHVA